MTRQRETTVAARRVEIELAAERLSARCREELARADGKASLLIGVAIGGLGLFGPRLMSPEQAGDTVYGVALLGYLGVAVWCGALIAFTSAVFPRLKSKASREQVAYFGHIAQIKNVKMLHEYVKSVVATSLETALTQTWDLSRIVVKKYRYIQLGVWLLAVGTVMQLAAWLA
ncbi:MAG TPA: Pycsar system effector family protein [Micromonosporaceae bacterium]